MCYRYKETQTEKRKITESLNQTCTITTIFIVVPTKISGERKVFLITCSSVWIATPKKSKKKKKQLYLYFTLLI